ncbi:MAG: hypothetical protein ABIN97_11985 [Ginsengibacter sp.]
MKINFFLLLFASIASCESDNKNLASQTETPAKPSPANCYRFINSNDTITLKLIHTSKSITGTLVYKLKEKDKNEGTIQGGMKGDLLVADYTFMSEGSISVRQVVFKKQGNYFIEGYGDIETINERLVFKNTDSLEFNNSMRLLEINCQK